METEPDTQVPTETLPLSNNRSDEYEHCRGSDQMKYNTKPDAEDDDIPDATGTGLTSQITKSGRTDKLSRSDCASFDHRRITGGSTR